MRVRMRVDITGTRNGQDWPPRGGIADVTKDEADALIAAGMAVAADEPKTETAALPEKSEKRSKG